MELNSYKVSIIFLLGLLCGSLHASLAHRGFYVRLDGVYYNTHVDNIAARFSEQSLNDRISEAWENVAKKTSNETKNYTLITTLGYRFNQFFGIEIGIEKSPKTEQSSDVMAIDYQDLSSINYYTFKNSATIKQMVVRILPVLHFPIYKSGFTLLVKAGVDIIKQKLDINSRGDYYSSFAIPSIHTVKWITHLNRSSIFLTPEVGLGLSYQFPNSYHWSLQLQWLHAFSLNQYYNFNDPTQADTVLQPSNHSIKVKKYSAVDRYTLGVQYLF